MKPKKGFFDNCGEFFNMANSSRKSPGLIGVLFILFCFVIFEVLASMGISVMFYFIPWIRHITSTDVGKLFLGELAPFILVILLVFWRVRHIEKRSVWTLGFPLKAGFKEYLHGFVIGTALYLLCFILIIIFGGLRINSISLGNRNLQDYLVSIFMLVFWIVQGAKEEIIFRGWPLPILGSNYSYGFSIVITSVIFGAVHISNPGITPLEIVNTTLMGLLLALYCVFKGSLWGACAIHSAWNWMQVSVSGFRTSVIDGSKVLPVLFEIQGNRNQNEIEGEILNTTVLIAAIVIILLLIRNKNARLNSSMAVSDSR